MRNMTMGLTAMVIGGLVAGELAVAEQGPQRQRSPAAGKTSTTMPTPMTMTAQDTLKDIEATVGFVPQFFRTVADTQLPSFWTSFKTFQMNPDTALDAKTKELIGLAVASQIPCDYCIEFHTAVARKNGATEQQIREAVGMAAMTRMASTVINGNQVDKVQFSKDLQRMAGDAPKKPAAAARR